MRAKAALGVVLLAVLCPLHSAARDCPSRLRPNQWEPRDLFSIGLELRGFYIGADVGGGLPRSRTAEGWVNDPAGGLRLLAGLYPLDGLSITGEFDLTVARDVLAEGDELKVRPRVTEALVDYDTERWGVGAGVQTLTLGSGAMLDQRFLALDLRLKTRIATLDLFGGTTNQHLMKSATNCIFVSYTAHTQGWRTIGEGILDSYMAGAILSFKTLQPFTFQLMYLFAWPDVERLRGHGGALALSGPIISQRLSMSIETMWLVDDASVIQPAVLAELRSRPFGGLRLRLGAATSFGGKAADRFKPVFENLSWGILQRFNLYQGRLAMGRAAYAVNRYFKPFAGYYLRFLEASLDSENTGDELDVGVDFRISDLYTLRAAYIGTNYIGPHQTSHMCYVELRLILGAQLNALSGS
jgi:hypothetical protein